MVACSVLPLASMTPAVRTHTWMGRTATCVTVSVSSLAWDSVIDVARGRAPNAVAHALRERVEVHKCKVQSAK